MENQNSTFIDIGVGAILAGALRKQKIVSPTEIQALSYKSIAEGKDTALQSETGSGKTLAYVLPIFNKIQPDLRAAQALIITPTHELAHQIYNQCIKLSQNGALDIRSEVITGGANVKRQLDRLKLKPHIIIGSSGRILDLIKKRKLSVHNVKTIVIDEADRMLDNKNIDDVKALVKCTLKERQIVIASASLTADTIERAKQISNDINIIKTSQNARMPENIEHYYIVCQLREKNDMLRKIIAAEKPTKAIVFINNTENIAVTTEKLLYKGIKSVCIHGKMPKDDRKNAISTFRDGRAQALVASDITSRGIDIEGVSHVINMDIPEEPHFYLHRAGRTGRKGEKGVCISIVTPYQKRFISKYKTAYKIPIQEVTLKAGKLVLIKP